MMLTAEMRHRERLDCDGNHETETEFSNGNVDAPTDSGAWMVMDQLWKKTVTASLLAVSILISTMMPVNSVPVSAAATLATTTSHDSIHHDFYLSSSASSSSLLSSSSRPSIVGGQRYWSIMQTQISDPTTTNRAVENQDNAEVLKSDDDAKNAAVAMITAELPSQYLEQQRMERLEANKALIDYAVGTINTQYYDNSGGAWFNPTDFYNRWRTLKQVANARVTPTTASSSNDSTAKSTFLSSLSSSSAARSMNTAAAISHVIHKEHIPDDILSLDTREGTVKALKWLVASLQDPYSKYLTREELLQERTGNNDGFLGTGAYVDVPSAATRRGVISLTDKYSPSSSVLWMKNSIINNPNSIPPSLRIPKPKALLSISRVDNLPVVKAIAPNSPAERAGLVVGDRIVAVGDRNFLGWNRDEVSKILSKTYSQTDNSYVGVADLTIAKPVYAYENTVPAFDHNHQDFSKGSLTLSSPARSPKEIVLGYRSFRVHIPSRLAEQTFSIPSEQTSSGRQGNTIVQYELLSSTAGSIFDRSHSEDVGRDDFKVGYIRLTRFSKASTAGYLEAVQTLEEAGAQSYIIDLRNNYGGVIQEAMMTASTLLRDPHAILCWTLNARGGFVPHDVEEYAVDSRYPGYLLSREPQTSTLDQLQREQPQLFVRNGGSKSGSMMMGGPVDVKHALADGILAENWDPPSSFASVHEHVIKRGIRRISTLNDMYDEHDQLPLVAESSLSRNQYRLQRDLSTKAKLQQEKLNRKEIVVLINEGTASAAEFFTAAMQDNGRCVVVGTTTYGKGLIQHTFPLPDGGGLKITIGEYLRPSLRHVTHVGGARFDPTSGELLGGVKPDVFCDSRQGIPGRPSSDLCVGVALDILEENASSVPSSSSTSSSSQLIVVKGGK
jgi:C-terminal processing protease CtpA/Prc